MRHNKTIFICVLALLAGFLSPALHAKPHIVKAGRSPIPTTAETFTTPLPFRRLLPLESERPPLPAEPVIWYRAPIHLCRTITAYGQVTRVKRNGGISFLNFSDDWKNDFTVVVFSDAYKGIPTGSANYYRSKTIAVTGRVSLYKGKPQIEIRDANNIALIPDTATPKPDGFRLPAWLTAKGETPQDNLPDGVIWWTDATNHMHKTMTFRAKIMVTRDIGSLTFLNFSEQWQNRFHAVIFRDSYDLYPQPPEQHFLGKTVEITARISAYRGRPQAIIRSPDDIRIVK